jgi:hypothetical protein
MLAGIEGEPKNRCDSSGEVILLPPKDASPTRQAV